MFLSPPRSPSLPPPLWVQLSRGSDGILQDLSEEQNLPVMERWTPFEISLFEKSLLLFSSSVLHLEGRVILAWEPLIKVAFTEEVNSGVTFSRLAGSCIASLFVLILGIKYITVSLLALQGTGVCQAGGPVDMLEGRAAFREMQTGWR